jgi:RNA-directed DNA polymerase
MVLQVQDALPSKSLSVMERIRNSFRPERELNFGGCSLVRESEEPSDGRKQMTVTATGALPDHALSWRLINWDVVYREVKRLQMRIAKAVKEQRWNKVKALQWLLTHSINAKLLAVRRVSTNKGAKTPGIDGEVWLDPASRMKGALSLSRRGYRALPLRRVFIPKKNQGKRPLGIPVMKDRAQQALHLLALEPVAEMGADPNSYGFRPYRACRDAIGQCFCALAKRQSARWILEGDIKACFDGISHDWLRKNIPIDRHMLDRWLSCGYMQGSRIFPITAGTPQGGIISPTLANMALDGMEAAIRNGAAGPGQKVNFVRYADDFIVTAASKEILVEKVTPVIKAFLHERGLILSEEKTHITRIEDGFDFLSQNVRKYNNKMKITPAKEAVKRCCDKLKETVKSFNGDSAAEMIKKLNQQIFGWAMYHRYIQSAETFYKIDYVVFNALTRWMRRRHPNKSVKWLKKKYIRSTKKRNWNFSVQYIDITGNKATVYLLRMVDVARVRYIKIKGHATPYDPTYKQYFVMRSKASNIRLVQPNSQ